VHCRGQRCIEACTAAAGRSGMTALTVLAAPQGLITLKDKLEKIKGGS
jgi:hypothetical protein